MYRISTTKELEIDEILRLVKQSIIIIIFRNFFTIFEIICPSNHDS